MLKDLLVIFPQTTPSTSCSADLFPSRIGSLILMHSKLTIKCGLNVNVRYTLAFRKLQTLLVHRSLERSIVLKVCTRELWSRLPATVWALQWPNLQQWLCWRTVSQLTTWLNVSTFKDQDWKLWGLVTLPGCCKVFKNSVSMLCWIPMVITVNKLKQSGRT